MAIRAQNHPPGHSKSKALRVPHAHSMATVPPRAGGRTRINKRYFQAAIADRGKSQKEIATAMGLDASAVSLIFSGQRKLQLDEAADLARLLDLPLTEVFRNAGIEPPRTHAVALRGFVDALAEVHYFTERGGGLVDCPVSLPEGAMAFQCRTAMSGLEYLDGWLLFVPPPSVGHSAGGASGAGGADAAKVDDALNRLSIIKLEGGTTMLGYLKRGYSAGRYSIYLAGLAVQDATVEWAVPVKLAMGAQ